MKNGDRIWKSIRKNQKVYTCIMLFLVLVLPVLIVRIYLSMATYEGLSEPRKYPRSQIDMGLLYQNEYNLRDYQENGIQTKCGIDVSEHQGEIDWAQVADSGVEFAIIRVGYRTSTKGEIYGDVYYDANMRGASKAGIELGAYFFSQATSVKEAIQEAEFVIEQLAGYDVTMPVAFDMEDVNAGQDRISHLTVKEKTEIADAFCYTIRRAGYTPVVYGNPTWIASSYELSYLTAYDLWLAHYTDYTSFQYAYCMWQYNSAGGIAGIGTGVDLNLYFYEE